MPTSAFAEAASRLGFPLDATAIERFDMYRALMIEAATKFSLTNIRDPDAIDRRHFLDALAQGRCLIERDLLPQGCRVIDIGSGAGLPGLPLKIARPDLRLTLLDSHSKRCAFLREVVREFSLENVEVIEGRAEEYARAPALRESFDLALARAVAPLPVLIEYTLPFLRLGGHLAAVKGAGASRELEVAQYAIDELGGAEPEIVELGALDDGVSHLVLVTKARPTPERYPRRTGIPSKRPLV